MKDEHKKRDLPKNSKENIADFNAYRLDRYVYVL